eukprot:1873929-Prymnesium_polylepis.1
MAISALAPDPAPAAARTCLPRPHALTARVAGHSTSPGGLARSAGAGTAAPSQPCTNRKRSSRARFSDPALATVRARACLSCEQRGLDGRRGVQAGLGAGSTELRGAARRRMSP